MCGLCGIVNFRDQLVNETPIRNMMKIMKHRGPDDEGVFMEDRVGLGFVRLSIIDLTPAGHQPMFSDDGRYVMVYNGEIYNYIELREELKREGVTFHTQSDSEVVLKSYIHWGEDCQVRFDGMWTFVIYDRTAKTVFATRDRFGIKPLYYVKTDDYFAFSSEIPPLLSLHKHKPKADFQTIFDYLVFNRTDQTERTFFETVKKLQHGHKMRISDDQVTIEKWYDLRAVVAKTEGFSDPAEFRELLSSSVRLRLRSDVPVGVCLSGGLDSSSIVSLLLHDCHKDDLNTFSVVYNKGQIGDESEFIQEYRTQLTNMFFISPNDDSLKRDFVKFIKVHAEPIPSTSPYAQYKLMELAKDHVVVTLDGQGADEQLAGYHYFFGFFFKDLLKRLSLWKLISEMAYYLVKHRSLVGIKCFVYSLLSERVRTLTKVNNKGYIDADFVNRFNKKKGIASSLYGSKSLNDALMDHFEYKLEHLLKWEDLNSMAFSIEARVPFLDFRLVEKSLATSSKLIIHKGMTKQILREAMTGLLPEKIRLRRDKIGFATPQDEWFRKPEWEIIIREILTSNEFINRKLIDAQKALAQYEQHLSGKINISNEIWKWINMEIWFRIYIDE